MLSHGFNAFNMLFYFSIAVGLMFFLKVDMMYHDAMSALSIKVIEHRKSSKSWFQIDSISFAVPNL